MYSWNFYVFKVTAMLTCMYVKHLTFVRHYWDLDQKKMPLRAKHCVTFCNLPILIKQSFRRLSERQTVAQRFRSVRRRCCKMLPSHSVCIIYRNFYHATLRIIRTCRHFCYCFHVIYFYLFLPRCLQKLKVYLIVIKPNNTRMNDKCDFLRLF
jgi:hypothetical protein